jgi:hypothetical protein
MSQIYVSGGAIKVIDVNSDTQIINPGHFDWELKVSNYFVRDGIQNQSYDIGTFAVIQDKDGNPFASVSALEQFLNNLINKTDVTLQDQVTRPIIAKFNRVLSSTTLAVGAIKGDTSITLTSTTSVAVGRYLILFNPTTAKYGFWEVTSVLGSPTFQLDSQLDSDFPAGTFVDVTETDLSTAVGSLGSPITFGLRGTGAPPGVDVTVDITRIIFTATATSSVDLTKFINLARLSNGLLLRRRNSVTENVFNVKDNKEIASLMYDVEITAATNPNQGIDGLIGRLTFAGQSKIGVAIRLPIGDDLELLVQDDLNTLQGGEGIIKFEITAEGHIVDE